MNFDYGNDFHVDFYVKHDGNVQKYEKKTRDYVYKLLPKQPSDTLIIGGDIGHYNMQNYLFMSELAKNYKRILLVFGNHDYYLDSSRQVKKYKRSSINRVQEMKEMYKELENVFVLEGNVIDVDGVKIGGLGMWYDFSYGQKEQNLSYDSVYQLWWKNSNDRKKIRGMSHPLELFQSSYQHLEHVINNSDVIVSHVGSDWRLYKSVEEDFTEHYNYYFFDGSPFYKSLEGKTWLFGHVHYDLDQIEHGCRFISHAIGYPDEAYLEKKIKQITL